MDPQSNDQTTAPADDATKCMIAHVDGINELAAACDYGWLGISDESVAALSPSDGPKRNVVVIVSIPARKMVCCYGIFLGSVTKRADLKEHIRRELPASWANVARIGWVRIGAASWDTVANVDPSAADLFTLFTSAADQFEKAGKTEASTTWTEIPRAGDFACASIDNSSLQVLPHDLRDLHLNPQAAVELAERNNATQAQRQMNGGNNHNQDRRDGNGGRFGHGTPGYTNRHQYNGAQPFSHYQQQPQQQQQGYYGQQQQQQGYGQQQPAYPVQPPTVQAPATAQQAPTDPAQQAALAQYYQYMATLTPEQQQVAYQHYVSQYYQQSGATAPAQ